MQGRCPAHHNCAQLYPPFEIMMDDAATPARAWPDQRLKILIPCWLLMVVSTVFVVWRFIYGALQLRRFLLCDYLLAVAAVSSHTCTFASEPEANNGRLSTSRRHVTHKSSSTQGLVVTSQIQQSNPPLQCTPTTSGSPSSSTSSQSHSSNGPYALIFSRSTSPKSTESLYGYRSLWSPPSTF